MQTFLPYPSFERSAAVLDTRRLGKQRVECLQILNTLRLLSSNAKVKAPWVSHPAVLSWRGHELALCEYGVAICREWKDRGYRDTCLEKILALAWHFDESSLARPPWIGRVDVHTSHRSNLLRKKESHYRQFEWLEPLDLPYVWPVTKRTGGSVEL